MSIADNNSAALFELMLHSKLIDLLEEFDPEEITAFIDKALDNNFNPTGEYTYYCNKCGVQYSFDNKNERAMFEKLHKTIGCNFKWKSYEKRKKTHWVKTRSEGFNQQSRSTLEKIRKLINDTKELMSQESLDKEPE